MSAQFHYLGIDPGSRYIGWGIIAASMDAPPRLVASGTIIVPRNLRGAPRLLHIWNALEKSRIPLNAIDGAALESPFIRRRTNAIVTMVEARGVIALWLAARGIEVHDVSPTAIKKAVTGDGSASKMQVAWEVSGALHADITVMSDHETDALAGALWLSSGRSA